MYCEQQQGAEPWFNRNVTPPTVFVHTYRSCRRSHSATSQLRKYKQPKANRLDRLLRGEVFVLPINTWLPAVADAGTVRDMRGLTAEVVKLKDRLTNTSNKKVGVTAIFKQVGSPHNGRGMWYASVYVPWWAQVWRKSMCQSRWSCFHADGHDGGATRTNLTCSSRHSRLHTC